MNTIFRGDENEAAPRGGLALVRTASAARLDGLEETRKWDDDAGQPSQIQFPRFTVSTMSLMEVDLGRAPGSMSLLAAF
jgi:hypothetical protein